MEFVAPIVLKRDPKMKRVGRKKQYVCAQETCDNPLDELTVGNLDPFCSVACCHSFHGVEIQLPKRGSYVASTM
jgi:hypothetical protein